MRIHLVLIATLISLRIVAVDSNAQAQQITFQGLTGSDGRREVKAKFPTAVTTNTCAALGFKNKETLGTGPGAADCNSLEISNYEVAGIKFDLSFSFDALTKKTLLRQSKLQLGRPSAQSSL